MSIENATPAPTPAPDTAPDTGVEATPEEARLAAQLDGLGENPTEEPAATPAPAPASAPAPTPAPDPAAEAAAAAPPAAAPAPTPAPAVVAAAAEPLPERPTAAKDFDAEAKALFKRWDEGDLSGEEYQAQLRTLTQEETAYAAKLAVWEDRAQSATQRAATVFNETALQWETDHADFMSDPIRAQAMQRALSRLDDLTGGALAPADLFARAEALAFDTLGYKAPAPAAANPNASADAARAAIDKALEGRTPNPVPTTLGNAPAAAGIEKPATSAYAELDTKDINSLEDQIARMSPDQLEAYLRDAPGAGMTGQE